MPFINEIKNISGILFFDQKFHQLNRTDSEKEEVFSDPLLQAQKHQRQFSHWLVQQKHEPMPIEYLVTISNPSTIIKTNVSKLEKVCHAAFLLNKIQELQVNYTIQKYPLNTLKKLARLIVKKHTPLSPNILQKFEIPKTDILTGVRCTQCSVLSMDYQRGMWICPSCQFISKDAYIEAIDDYFLLLAPTITLSQFRAFLKIPSRSSASKLLTSMGLPYTGERKGRIYHRKSPTS